MPPFLRSCLAALSLSACAAIAPSTVERLASLDPLTADPAGIELVVILPEGLAIQPGSAKLEFGAERADEARKGSFALEDRPVPEGIAIPARSTARRYGLTAADAQRMRDLQAEISTWKREGKAVGRLGLGISGCALGDGPAPDARGSVLIRLAPAEAFLPLISDGRLADLLGPNALAAIEPCKAAQ